MARRPARKTTSRKTTGRKTAARKATAKKAATKKTARKTTGKTASRSKTAARKTTRTAARKTSGKTARRGAAKKSARARREPLAIQLLKQDHREVETMAAEFERARDTTAKGQLARRICEALTVHAQLEEELFYPRAREQGVDEDLLDEAYVEHQSAKDLIAQIEGMSPGDRYFDAKVKVLTEYVKHHVQEEENELFPQVQRSVADLDSLGEEMQARKAALGQA